MVSKMVLITFPFEKKNKKIHYGKLQKKKQFKVKENKWKRRNCIETSYKRIERGKEL